MQGPLIRFLTGGSHMRYIVTTEVGVERVAAGHIVDLPGAGVQLAGTFQGLLIVTGHLSIEGNLSQIPEVSVVIPIDLECRAELDTIVRCGGDLANGRIPDGKTFAVNTVRRGKHGFTSIDVNVALGGVVRRDVNLERPDYTVCVQIIDDLAYLAVLPGRQAMAKTVGYAHRIASRISVVQMFYKNESELTEAMGHRIGRAAQAFGVKELVLAHGIGTEAEDFARFCRGAAKGRQTRLKKVRRIHGHRTRKVPIRVADIYQAARHKQGEPIVMASAFGEPISACCGRVAALFEDTPTVNLFIGARDGLPKGIHRFADVILNLAPGMTFATEHGIPAALTGLVSCVQFGDEEDPALAVGE